MVRFAPIRALRAAEALRTRPPPGELIHIDVERLATDNGSAYRSFSQWLPGP
jgi:hypothetical protein